MTTSSVVPNDTSNKDNLGEGGASLRHVCMNRILQKYANSIAARFLIEHEGSMATVEPRIALSNFLFWPIIGIEAQKKWAKMYGTYRSISLGAKFYPSDDSFIGIDCQMPMVTEGPVSRLRLLTVISAANQVTNWMTNPVVDIVERIQAIISQQDFLVQANALTIVSHEGRFQVPVEAARSRDR